LLEDWTPGNPIALPNIESLCPYVGLYSLVFLHLDQLTGLTIQTPYLPSLSMLRQGQFIHAPSNKSATAMDVTRIFDSLAVTSGTQRRSGSIPLSPELSTFNQRRYWRIPATMGAILVALQERVGRKTYASKEITYTQNIFHVLRLKKCYRSISISIPGLTLPDSGGLDDVEGSSGPPERREGAGEGAGDDTGPSRSGIDVGDDAVPGDGMGDGAGSSEGGDQGLGKRKCVPSDVEEAADSVSGRESGEFSSKIAYIPLSHLDQ